MRACSASAGALDALGLDGSGKLDIVLMQLVKLLRDGELVIRPAQDVILQVQLLNILFLFSGFQQIFPKNVRCSQPEGPTAACS